MTAYDPDRHATSLVRIWEECGWIERGNTEQASAVGAFAGANRSWVLEHKGDAEVAVFLSDGVMRYDEEDLPLAAVTAVTSSLIHRRRGGAGALLANAIAHDAERGAVVAGLGVFDHGYYDRLGFGTGTYEHWYQFDPRNLRVPRLTRPPVRLGLSDADAIHASRVAVPRLHGDCALHEPRLTAADMVLEKDCFGLGFRDGETVTHHLWIQAENLEKSTWTVMWSSYRTKAQFVELLSLISSLSDQVQSIELHEPSWLQIQELIERPFRAQEVRRGSEKPSIVQAESYWQTRILDLERAIAACAPLGARYRDRFGGTIEFTLELSDPIETFLDTERAWRGCAGTYRVVLDDGPVITNATDDALPTLSCSVNAYTRLWLGVASATTLEATGEIDAPTPLLESLDRFFRLPTPTRFWDF
jgi:predicted acetyltransferase